VEKYIGRCSAVFLNIGKNGSGADIFSYGTSEQAPDLLTILDMG
jgi:hypothetical protein